MMPLGVLIRSLMGENGLPVYSRPSQVVRSFSPAPVRVRPGGRTQPGRLAAVEPRRGRCRKQEERRAVLLSSGVVGSSGSAPGPYRKRGEVKC